MLPVVYDDISPIQRVDCYPMRRKTLVVRMSPAISNTNIADTAKDSVGISRKTAARLPRKASSIPTIGKPPMKLESLRFVGA